MTERKKQRKGFAVMPLAQRRAIASLGGKAAHANGTAHEWTQEQARAAGRKGGSTPKRPRTAKPLAA